MTQDQITAPHGYTVAPDSDQPGKWTWRTASEGCDFSFNTEAEAVADAWNHEGGAEAFDESVANHTPGPWRTHANKRSIVVFASEYANKTVATVPIPQYVEAVSAPCNAQLIAAAPDLLEVLKRAEKLARNVPVFADLLPSMRDAITRATILKG